MLSSVWYDPDATDHGDDAAYAKAGPVRRIALRFDRRFERMADRYPAGLRWAMKRRWLVVSGAISSVVLAGAIYTQLGFTVNTRPISSVPSFAA